MKTKIVYTDAPLDDEISLDKAVIIPNFDLTPEDVQVFTKKRAKKAVNIYLTADTIERFRKAADITGNKYQTMISDVLDAYTERNLQNV